MTEGRNGAAMIAVVLLLLTATALAHGALLVARAELSASRGYARGLEEASAARVAMDQVLAGEIDADVTGLPLWGAVELPGPAEGAGRTHRLRRLGAESWWLEPATSGLASRRVGTPGRLLWWLDPVTRIRALGAIVTVGEGAPVLIDGAIARTGFGRADPPLDADTCAAEIGTAFEGTLPDAVAVGSGASASTLGLLTFEAVWSLTDVEVAGTGVPSANDHAGTCATTEPWNWGDPERPAGACRTHVAIRRAADTLHVAGGEGQAMLVVDGDLILSGDARLHGMVVATGAVTLLDQSELHGIIVAQGGLRVASGAAVHGSGCWAARALRAGTAEWMPSPLKVPGLSFIAP